MEEALWPSLEELVSVEKPESCTTLPLLFSPLFGSFLPLCELLRLRVSDEDDASAPEEGAAAADDVDGSLCDSFRFIRMPGSHSRLLQRKRKFCRSHMVFIYITLFWNFNSPGGQRGAAATYRVTATDGTHRRRGSRGRCGHGGHLVLEVGKSFYDQVPELQQSANLVLQLLQRLGLLAVYVVAPVAIAVRRVVAQVVVVQVVRIRGTHHHGRRGRGGNGSYRRCTRHQMWVMGSTAHRQAFHGPAGQVSGAQDSTEMVADDSASVDAFDSVPVALTVVADAASVRFADAMRCRFEAFIL